MSESNAPTAPATPEPALFSALLTPHRSLSSAGFFVVMGLIAGISFVGGVVFLIAGAWPVIGFLGLDVALEYWAFRRSEEHTSELQSHSDLVCRLLLEKKKKIQKLYAYAATTQTPDQPDSSSPCRS